jgi:hypothetical protein
LTNVIKYKKSIRPNYGSFRIPASITGSTDHQAAIRPVKIEIKSLLEDEQADHKTPDPKHAQVWGRD